MAFYFFTEVEKLNTQTSDKAYGAVNENEYRLNNLYSATADAKAFAICSGTVMIQDNKENTELVNLVLKPSEQPDLGLPRVNYFIYKNILKSSLINSSGVIADRSKNSLNNKIWASFDKQVAAFKDNPGIILPENPLPEDVLGYHFTSAATGADHAADTDDVTLAFFGTSHTLFFINGGDYIGDFHSQEFGLLINTEKIGSYLNFGAARETDTKLTFGALAPTATNADLFKRRHDKEAILAYLDSSAFFGSFTAAGLNIADGNTFSNLTGEDLYSQVTSKNYSKEKIYLDLRNEYNDSFNYYHELDDQIKLNLDNGDSFSQFNYYRDGWPIFVLNNSEIAATNNDKVVKIAFTKPDELAATVYLKRAFTPESGLDVIPLGSKRFIDLPDDTDDDGFAALPANLLLPNLNNQIISGFLQLKYFPKNIPTDVSSQSVSDASLNLSKTSYLDNLFPLFDMKIPFDQNSGKSIFKLYYDVSYVDKGLINNADFSASLGIAEDKSLFCLIVLPSSYNVNIEQNTDDKLPVGSMEGALNGLFLNELKAKIDGLKMILGRVTIQGVSKDYLQFLVDEVNSDESQLTGNYTFNDVAVIGLTHEQYSNIKTIKEQQFPDNYKVYIGISDIVEGIDDSGTTYTSFKYVLNGLTQQGDSIVKKTVETGEEAFTNIKIIGKDYQRNAEEAVGYDHLLDSVKYEDYFIGKINEVKTLVDSFISQINEVDINQPSAQERIEFIAKKSFALLWSTAKTYVQLNASNADDRPLYWARIKMQVALKQHPFFRSGIMGSNVVEGSSLDHLLTITEELSRNYNISFADAPPGTKKILITGFDPFQLNQWQDEINNVLQSNPSGCCALALHGTTTANGLAYIQAMIAPVRYTDFDGSKSPTEGEGYGIIEKYIQPQINDVDMIITISQSAPGDYNIDKYGTSRRGGDLDNLSYTRILHSHCVPIEDYDSLEWINTTLRDNFIVAPVKYNWAYTNASGVKIDNSDQHNPPEIGQILWEGSGQNYLSNEIFYRVGRLRTLLRSELQTGHFHISQIQTGHDDFNGAIAKTLVDTVRTAINNGVTGL